MEEVVREELSGFVGASWGETSVEHKGYFCTSGLCFIWHQADQCETLVQSSPLRNQLSLVLPVIHRLSPFGVEIASLRHHGKTRALLQHTPRSRSASGMPLHDKGVDESPAISWHLYPPVSSALHA